MTESNATQPGAVVVGVDGSEGSQGALDWAVAEARMRKAPLRIVHAWKYGFNVVGPSAYIGDTSMLGMAAGYMGSVGFDSSELHQAAESHLREALSKVLTEVTDLLIERQVMEGSPAEVLVGAVTEDDLLVVGSRGHGGFAGLLLGSVSQQCVHHSPCPVVIVHTPKSRKSKES